MSTVDFLFYFLFKLIIQSTKHISYSYSEKALNLIFEEIKKDPEHIIQNLKERLQKNKSTPGAKEF